MEINDYLRVVSKQSRFIGAVALAALVLSAATYMLEPPRYRATATVVIPAPTGTTSLIAAVSQAVSDFDGAISSDAVASEVSAATGIPKGRISSDLVFDRLVSSSVAEVSFEGRTAEEAQVVAREASRQALALLLGADLAPYEEQKAFAQDALTRAEDEYQAFIAATGLFDPERYFSNQTARLVSLRDELGAASTAGDQTQIDFLEQRIAAKQAEVSTQLAEYNRLSGARQRALALVTEVESAYATAQAALDGTQTADAIKVSDAVRVSQVASLLRSVVPAVVIATGLAIGFVILLELSRSGRWSVRRAEATLEPSRAEEPAERAEAAGGPRPAAAGPGEGPEAVPVPVSPPIRVAREGSSPSPQSPVHSSPSTQAAPATTPIDRSASNQDTPGTSNEPPPPSPTTSPDAGAGEPTATEMPRKSALKTADEPSDRPRAPKGGHSR